MPLIIGQSYVDGRYRIVRLLGQGGYGAVYQAVDTRTGGAVAVKLSEPRLPVDRERFDREQRVQERLGGDHIVRALGSFTTNGAPCTVLEFMTGGSLADDAVIDALDSEAKLNIVVDVLRALEAAHAAHVVHRDVKPANVLLDDRRRAKLADFGCAHDPGDVPLTRTNEVLGTEAWMAPEQAAAQPADPRDDLFAAGLLLNFLLTGERPHANWPSWRPRLAGLDEPVRSIVARATAPRRADRFTTAAAMRAALEGARGRAVTSHRARPVRRLSLTDLRLMSGPREVRQVFRKLGYPVLPDEDFVADQPGNFELWGRAAELTEEGWTLADFRDGVNDLFVILLRLKDLRGSTVRTVAAAVRAVPARFLFVLTDRFDRFVFVSPRRDADGTYRLAKLVVDREHPTRHALEVLEAIAAPSRAPDEVYATHVAAFDVDRVTSRFYREYARLVERAVQNVREWNPAGPFNDPDHPEVADRFVQRLFSRILFLFFLQKKGWLNNERDFLRNQYLSAERDRRLFFAEVLEPLFFEVLNTDRPGAASPFGIIPYLNGGLFDKEYRDSPVILNQLFDADSDDGILGFLGGYDFTIEEDTPAEMEVALDPEMLGKVFEQLLDPEHRNAAEAFYTPRPLVNFMCREALLAEMQRRTSLPDARLRQLFEERESYDIRPAEARNVERALENLRVLDPAVGSGAFLVGMLQEMIQVRRACKVARQAEAARTGAEVADWKRAIIQHNLYGVDIERHAIEIARLRLWLALVVDLDVSPADVEPLPNLDYRIRDGNSLLEAFGDSGGLNLDSDAFNRARADLARLRDGYFTITEQDAKKAAREQIAQGETALWQQWLDDRLAEQGQQFDRLLNRLAGLRDRDTAAQRDPEIKALAQRIERLQRLRAGAGIGRQLPFSFRLNFSEAFADGGFDIVIANPPYMRVQQVNGLDYAAALQQAAGWLDDLYVHFLFRGFELARPGGVVCFITADTFLTIGSKQRLRDLLLSRRLLALARCDPFAATVDTAVILARNEPAGADDRLLVADGNRRPAALFAGVTPAGGWPAGVAHAEHRVAMEGAALAVRERAAQDASADPIPQYDAPLLLYRQAVKRAFFAPSAFNLALYERFMPQMRALVDSWWEQVRTSAALAKHARALAAYRAALRPGDVTLLGLVTEGGVGLQTSDNPKYLAHLAGSREGERNEAFLRGREAAWAKEPRIGARYQELLRQLPRDEAVDQLRRELGSARLGIGRMALYRTVAAEQTADPATLTEEEQRHGIAGPRCWVPFRKGDRAGNRWLSDEPLFIRWDRETVRFFYDNSGKKGANMPVMRNPQMYFQPMISWTTVGRDAVIRARLQPPAVFDHGTPTLHSIAQSLPNEVLLAVLNSPLATHIVKTFLNNTKFELNDVRMLPLVAPDDGQRQALVGLVGEAMAAQRRLLAGQAGRELLAPVEARINAAVLRLYGIDPAGAPAWAREAGADAGDDAEAGADGAEA